MSYNLEHPFAGPPTNQDALRTENEKLKSRIDAQLTPVFEIIETQNEMIKDLRTQLAEEWRSLLSVKRTTDAYLEKYSND